MVHAPAVFLGKKKAGRMASRMKILLYSGFGKSPLEYPDPPNSAHEFVEQPGVDEQVGTGKQK